MTDDVPLNAQTLAQTRLARRFDVGLDIARYTARILRSDGARDENVRWAGLIAARQTALAAWQPGEIKGRYLCASSQTVDALEAAFGPLPSRHGDDADGRVAGVFAYLRLADAQALRTLFAAMAAAQATAEQGDIRAAQHAIDNFQTHVVPVIADIDADAADFAALAERAIVAGACTVRLNACSGRASGERQALSDKAVICQAAFERLGVAEGITVTRLRSWQPAALLRQKVTNVADSATGARTMADRPWFAAIARGRYDAAPTRQAAG